MPADVSQDYNSGPANLPIGQLNDRAQLNDRELHFGFSFLHA